MALLWKMICNFGDPMSCSTMYDERWGAGVETQKNVREEIGGWGRVPFNEPYAPLLSTIYDGAWGSLNFLKIGTRPQPPTSLYDEHSAIRTSTCK